MDVDDTWKITKYKTTTQTQLNPIHNENREITSNILNNTAGIGNTAQILACTISQISTCHLVGNKHFPSISMLILGLNQISKSQQKTV